MRVFFVQGQPGFSAKAQYAVILEKTGFAPGARDTRFYEPGKNNAEDLAAAAVASRGGVVETAYGLRPLGNTRQRIAASLKEAKAKVKAGCVVQDVVTGMRSDRDGVEMMDAALTKIHGELREPPEGFDGIGRKGAEGRWKKIHHERRPAKFVKEAWHDHKRFATDAEVVAWAGLGWSRSTILNEFGPSGRPRGRRPSKTGQALAPSNVAKRKRRK